MRHGMCTLSRAPNISHPHHLPYLSPISVLDGPSDFGRLDAPASEWLHEGGSPDAGLSDRSDVVIRSAGWYEVLRK